MAEAAVEFPPNLKFFCHKCSLEISPVLPDYTCPRCQSGFIEEVPQNNTDVGREESDEENIDPSIQFAELWSEFMQDIFRREDLLYPPQSLESSDNRQVEASQEPMDSTQTPNAFLRHMRRRSRTHPRNSRQRGEMRITDVEGGLQQLLASVAENRGAGFRAFSGFPIFLNLHGNPGDYAWGRGGLDAVISQLLNQLDGTGPPPLPKDKIDEIPTVEISKEQVDKVLQCTVCMEDFRVSEPVKRLACLHHFHRDCIIPWLELHGTCPICRKLLHENQSLSSQNYGTGLVGLSGGNLDMPGTSSTGSSRSSSSEASSTHSENNSSGTSTTSSSSSSSASHPITPNFDIFNEFE